MPQSHPPAVPRYGAWPQPGAPCHALLSGLSQGRWGPQPVSGYCHVALAVNDHVGVDEDANPVSRG
jgi:hypothetical protein